MEKIEIIYVLINEAMPGLVKIGKTSNLNQRLKDLDTTPTPLPFECYYACEVKDMTLVERKIHYAFGDHRIRKNREFFELSPDRVKSVLELIAIKEVTPKEDIVNEIGDLEALENYSKSKPRFKFSLADIKIGDTIYFSSDETITAIVKTDTTIEYQGKETSLSSATLDILRSKGSEKKSAQGPIYWKYKNLSGDYEILDERRSRIEKE